ncbi:VOC family protein [Actinomadura mexicana]|uniref:Glyoxalase-like domain-containing protein n=1 Tax=Actinomadura mexicana TaxID=134959 RepID=A0A239BR22_9ACTN|nr:VOC family protein [Actinomadura mexicana]SNS10477.1 hypothetical protein SAMN06265355_11163 [Actinomadura mexicana]
MASRLYHLVIDSPETSALPGSWPTVLDQPVPYRSDDEVFVGTAPDAYPRLCFIPDDRTKTAKNRLHTDLDQDGQGAEARRIFSLGARRTGAGRSADVPWVMLADPGNNEFCVLRPHSSLIE